MNIQKAHFAISEESLSISVPFQKVDKESRTVSGFATLNNVDRHDDIVTQDASMRAFSTFRGNLREMHQPIAVGKIIEVSPEVYYDGDEDQFYSGVYVTARVSKGAQDTWEKVLDGTLSGFSIGGKVLDAEVTYDGTLNKNIQIIKDMELYEVSLVDNPANPLANIISIQKAVGTQEQESTSHIYTCSACKMVVSSQASDRTCPTCASPMKDIGFMVSLGEGTEGVEKEIRKMFTALEVSASENDVEKNDPLTETDEISEGDISMEDEVKSDAEDTVIDEVVEEASEEAAEETLEDVSATEETAAVEKEDAEAVAFEQIAASLADLKEFVSTILETHAADIKAAQEATAAVSKSVKDVQENIATALTEVKEIRGAVDKVAKSVDDLEDSSAVQKSLSLGGDKGEVKKSIWGGTFLNVSDIENKEGR